MQDADCEEELCSRYAVLFLPAVMFLVTLMQKAPRLNSSTVWSKHTETSVTLPQSHQAGIRPARGCFTQQNTVETCCSWPLHLSQTLAKL